jgi:two-component system, LytTR family, sensor kinase
MERGGFYIKVESEKMSRSLRKLLPVLAWTGVGFVFATQLRIFFSRTGAMKWRDTILWEVPRWFLWALLAPVVTRLTRRYPLQKENAGKRVVLHTLLACAVSAVHLTLFVLLFRLLRMPLHDKEDIFLTFRFAFPLDFHVGIAVYWLILFITQSRDSEQRIARLQLELTQAQLQALKMQLHPHFLFNTLNSISSYLRKDVEIADEMIGRLGDFLRLTLQNPGGDEIALEKEIEFLRRYLDIEQLRFQDRLDAQFDIAPETLPALVPNLILQPVVENAVQHGISNQPGKGIIRIVSRRRDGVLQIAIHDNGPGLPDLIRQGIGISATRERLSQMYGAEGHFEITNSLAGGVIATLEIPFRLPEAS